MSTRLWILTGLLLLGFAEPLAAQDNGEKLQLANARRAQAALTAKKWPEAREFLPGFEPKVADAWKAAVDARIKTLVSWLDSELRLPQKPKGPTGVSFREAHDGLADILSEFRKLPPRQELSKNQATLAQRVKELGDSLAKPKPKKDTLAFYLRENQQLAQQLAQRQIIEQRSAFEQHKLFDAQIVAHKQRFREERQKLIKTETTRLQQQKLDLLERNLEGATGPTKTLLGKLIEIRKAYAALGDEQTITAQIADTRTKVSRERDRKPQLDPEALNDPKALERYTDDRNTAEALHGLKKAALEQLNKKLEREQKRLNEMPALVVQAKEALDKQEAVGTANEAIAQITSKVLGLLVAQETQAQVSNSVALDKRLVELAQLELELATETRRIARILEREARKRMEQLRQPKIDALKRNESEARRKAAKEKDPLRKFEWEMTSEIERHKWGLLEDEALLEMVNRTTQLENPENTHLEGELKKIGEQLKAERRGAISQQTVNHLSDRLKQLRLRLELLREKRQRWVRKHLDRKQTTYSQVHNRYRELEKTRTQLSAGKSYDSGGPASELSEDYRILMRDAGQARASQAQALYKLQEEKLKRVLKQRLDALNVLITKLKKLEQLYSEQLTLAGQLYALIVRRVYWMRTDHALGLATLASVPGELGRLRDTYRESGAGHYSGRWATAVLILFLLGLVTWIIPLAPPRRNYRGGLLLASAQRLAMILLVSGAAPLALLVGLYMLPRVNFSPAVETPIRALLIGLAGVLFARHFLAFFFRDNGLAESQLGVSEAVREELETAAGRLTVLALLLWLPWFVLSSTPTPPTAINRLIYSALLLLGALALIHLLRTRGPLIAAWTGETGFWSQAWTIVYPLVCLSFIGIIGMDLLGYRIGAWVFTQTVLNLLVAVTLLAYVHALCTRLVSRAAYALMRRAQPAESGSLSEESGESEEPDEADETDDEPALTRYKLFKSVVPQVSQLVGTAVLVIGVLVTAWGLDLVSGVREFCEGFELYRSGETVLSFWNLVTALGWVIGGHFLLHHLPSIYELVVFPRLKSLESATRYVILTLSRYAVLLVTYSAALISLQVNLASLGWLMAALSVGIGFGLQEIIANFISGLILLLERPIRVGDIVQVGNDLGVVKRINIRATIVENFDRLSIIVPNRKLITDNVINWTYSDPIKRRIIDVGVAYDSDIQQVLSLLSGLLDKHPGVLKDPAPAVLFLGFGDSCLNFTARFHSPIDGGMGVSSELHEQILEEFNRAGIEIPYPQQDLRVISVPGEPRGKPE